MNDERLNVYRCPECFGSVVTVDRVEGVTPMFLACRVLGDPTDPDNTCGGRMASLGYPPFPWPTAESAEPTWEWYRPEERELRALDRETLHHVEQGGLLIRKIEP